MNNADINEILAFACAASESGFQRVQIDPKDAIEIIDQRNQLLEALENLALQVKRHADFQGHTEGWMAFDDAMQAISKATGK